LATGSFDNTVKLWSFEPDGSIATCVSTLNEHRDKVSSVAFHPEGTILATGSFDRTVKLWRFSDDGSTVTCVTTLISKNGSVWSIAFNPLGTILAIGYFDNTAELWTFSPDYSTATCVSTLNGHTNIVYSVAFHPEGTILATGSYDKTVKLWSFEPDGLTATCVLTLNEHTDIVSSVAFHPEGTILATGSYDKTVKLWTFSPDYSTATCEATLNKHNNMVESVAFDSTGTILASGSLDKTTKLWLFSPDGLTMKTLKSNNEMVLSVAFHSKKPLLAIGFMNNNAKIWKLNIQNLPTVSPNLSNHLFAANDSGLTISINQDRKKIIEIKKKLLESTRNSANKSCPNFMPLYEKIMAIDLNGPFRFEFEGQIAQDMGGLSRSIFDKLLPVYTHKFFDSIEKNHEFVILKDMPNNETFTHDTEQLLLLAKKTNAKIFLRIDPRLLELLKSPVLEKYFSENKRKNFENIYKIVNQVLSMPNNTEFNNSYFLKTNKNKKNNTNNTVINRYKKEQEQEVKKSLLQEIRLRKFLVECGFSSWEQVQNMQLFIQKLFIQKSWDPKNFSFELKFDIESFSKKLKILKEIDWYNFTEISLDKFVKLSRNNSMQFDFNNLNTNNSKIYADYSFFRPFLNYILGPESTDEIRKLFVNYVAGTIYYPGELKLVLSHEFALYPFKSETCFQKLKFYKSDPDNPQFQIKTAKKFIENQIKPKGSVNFGLL
jgi:WD40 repeat protein